MEKEMLEILKEIQKDMQEMKSDIKGLKEGQERIENKVNGITEQTADLTEFRTTVITKLQELNVVEEVTKANRIEKC